MPSDIIPNMTGKDSDASRSDSWSSDPGAGTLKPSRYPAWDYLRWLFFFRLLMLGGLVLFFSPSMTAHLGIGVDAAMAERVLGIYTVLVLVSGVSLFARWPSRQNQVYLAIFVDLIAYTLLMHAGGGVSSGLGVLLAVAVAAGALLMEGRLSLLFASLASLAVIAEQTYNLLQGIEPSSGYTQAGLLGMLFFVVALVAHVLYRRVRLAEELAARRKVDIDDLSKLNAFIIEDMATGVVVVDGDRRIKLMNQAAREMVGVQTAAPGALLQEVCVELYSWLIDQFRSTAHQESVICVGDRDLRPACQLLGDYRAAGALLYLRDQQELIRKAQQIKLASLGTLTASIAHNIRNPLSAISHASQLLGEAQGLSADDRHLLAIIHRNCGRIDEIIRSVLQLSRRHQLVLQHIDLVDWLGEFCDEFRESHGLDVAHFRQEFPSSPVAVEVDPRHLHQITSNLCENALFHAGGPDAPPHIVVHLGRAECQELARIDVTDDGPGIDQELVGEVFNPFFTTRPSGTGLGLYIARELAETNGIRLEYHRLNPHGSCFRLVFST